MPLSDHEGMFPLRQCARYLFLYFRCARDEQCVIPHLHIIHAEDNATPKKERVFLSVVQYAIF
jgi:hypothetical protein